MVNVLALVGQLKVAKHAIHVLVVIKVLCTGGSVATIVGHAGGFAEKFAQVGNGSFLYQRVWILKVQDHCFVAALPCLILYQTSDPSNTSCRCDWDWWFRHMAIKFLRLGVVRLLHLVQIQTKLKSSKPWALTMW